MISLIAFGILILIIVSLFMQRTICLSCGSKRLEWTGYDKWECQDCHHSFRN